MIHILKKVGNAFVLLIILGLYVLGVVNIAMQDPSVQTYLTQKVVQKLSKAMGYPLGIERINVKWLDVISLEGVSVKDSLSQPMIDVGRIDINFNIWTIIENSSREIHLDEVTLYQPNVRLVKTQNGYLNMDYFISRINQMVQPSDTTNSIPNQNIPFTIGKATLTDAVFHYDDPREPYTRSPSVFDYYHFELRDLNVQLQDFLVLGDTIQFVAKDLTTIDRQSKLKVHDLDTRFMYCAKKIELASLSAYIGGSYLTNYLSFNYDKPSDFGDFNQKVRMIAHFENSRIFSDDLGLFHEYLLTLNETWRLSGDFDGAVDNFIVRNTDLRFGKGSRLSGDFGFKGLPDFWSTTMKFNLVSSRIETQDLVQYYPETDLHETFGKFGLVEIDGTFAGTAVDFDLKSNVRTEIGNLATDMLFHINDRYTSTYNGFLKTAGLNIGLLFDRPQSLQKLDFSGKIVGKGFDITTASANLDATVTRLGFNQYDYRNIQLRGNLQKAYFNGQVSSADTNLTFNLDGEIDLSAAQNTFDLQGVVQKANLMALGFSAEPLTLQTQIDAQIEGNTVDELVGRARFLNTFLLTPRNSRNLVMDTLLITSSQQPNERTIEVGTEFLDARFSGNFVISEALEDLSGLLQEYKLYFWGNESARRTYYARKNKEHVDRNYSVLYAIQGKNVSKLLDFVYPDLAIFGKNRVEGIFRMGNTAFLSTAAQIDTLKIGTNQFLDAEVDITTSKFVRSAEVLASALITSKNQKINTLAPTERLDIEAIWDKDHIDFTSGLRQTNSANRANLNGEVRFLANGFSLRLNRSNLFLLDEVWNVNPTNLITISGKRTEFSNLSLQSGKQRISLNGEMNNDSTRNLNFEIRNFRLSTLNPVFETQLGGIMDGTAELHDMFNYSELSSDFKVEGLSYENYELGNFSGSGEWDQLLGQFSIDAHLEKNLSRVFTLSGNYDPNRRENSLNLKADFNGTSLKIIEPFSEGLVSDVSGTAKGVVTVKGTPENPILNGQVKIDQGRLTFDYLQSVLSFADVVTFSESEIATKNMLVTDQEGNTATVRGGVYHDGFKLFSLGFNADMRNFKILNTTLKDNDLFYGTAYVSGKASLYGPIDNLTIEADVTSNKGTRMYIPLDGATEVTTQDYIQFVSAMIKNDSLGSQNAERRSMDVGGIKMDFNFNITPDAYCEIQLDRQAGDIIKAYGRGLLNMKVDTKGDFTMAGNYEIERGDYTFTFQNALNKKFTIKPGSRLTWSGDPYGALLDVQAGYTQLASLSGVLPGLSTTGNTASDLIARRYPVEVTIALTDRLLSPTIGYDLAVKEYPSSGEYRSAVAAFESRLKSDEQELSRQVSSLILFNQLLSPQDVFLAQPNQSQSFIGNSISELVSNQISKWASALNENLEVGVTGLSLDQNAFDNLQLRFSYRFLNDRFRVTRDGRFTYGSNQYDATSLLGEWTLEYWMSQSGSVRLKAYNRNIQSPLLLNNALTTGGVSMQFTHSFNRFKLLNKTDAPSQEVPRQAPLDPLPSGKLTSKLEE
ncbi:translocation/assembly module TamB domain-containing protein [Arundinibacter roseus]|uniref:Translocation/assembly module TamB n=1 Tax=Arundinibacter roseus TaxID=2070510 RepID=A0A4V2XAP0_9BACT|nr:translocation/assembly module TamB domain-containing protein [Arundinibacter roseus]TDB68175.1 translocation/assembly module TamB [Arundinibacter roseus]